MFLKEVQFQKIENNNGWVCPKCDTCVAPTEKICPKCSEELKEGVDKEKQILID